MNTILQIQQLNSLAELTLSFLIGASLLSFVFLLVIFFIWLDFDKYLRYENK